MMRTSLCSLFLLLFLSRTVALPSGASNCVGGRAAVGVSHLEGRVTKGSLEEGGLSLSIGDTTLQVGTIAKFPKGETLEWTLVADDRPFRGFLIRAEDRSDDVSKKRGTTQALDSDDDLAKIAETVCVNAFNVGGITHTNNNQKRRISGTFRMDEAVEELQIDVTAVIKNRGSVSIYYYTGYVVSIVDDTTVEEVETTTIPLGNGVVPLVLRASSCSDEDPCGLCEGDCNKNSHCQGDMECFFRPDQTEVPGCYGDGTPGTDYCYVPRSNTLRIRSVSCSPEQPCDQCEGSCQNEEECSDGLTCFLRPDTSPVPNCDGTGISGRNYCFNQTLAGYDVPTLVSTECNRTQPCVECEGQCQSDSDCRGNLRCFIRPDLTPIPGCSQSFLGISGRNYCFESEENTLTLRSIQCASSTPCDACEGECNDDTDCRGNLKCLKRFDDEPVAGCLGNPIQARDYCYDPNAEVIPGATITSSSPEPTRAPSAVPPGTPSPTEKPTARPTRKPTPIPTINDDAEVPTLASNNAAKTLTLRNRECSAADPCGNCEGDCDTNEDCDGILQCFLRPDNTPVPGCQGVGVSGQDYCAFNPAAVDNENGLQPTPAQQQSGSQPTPPRPTYSPYIDDNNEENPRLVDRATECSPSNPCGNCMGDCDSNEDCDGILQCFFRRGNENVPGCFGTGVSGRDYCAYNPAVTDGGNNVNNNDNAQPNGNGVNQANLLNTRNQDCTPANPCLECQGDCDSDDECRGSLQCFFRRDTENVPGCDGSGVPGLDYCAFNPNMNNRKVRRREM